MAHKIVLFDQANYLGQSATFTDEVENLNKHGWGDKVSSIRVVSGKWAVYNNPFFGGESQTLEAGRNYANASEWKGENDNIESIKPVFPSCDKCHQDIKCPQASTAGSKK